MAYNTSFFFKSILVLITLLLTISIPAQSINLTGFGGKDGSSSLSCNSVYGAESGDTCATVAQGFQLSIAEFLSINPNLNCKALFVGQWLCVDAST